MRCETWMKRACRLATIPLAIVCLWAGAGRGVVDAQADTGTPAEVAKLVSALSTPALEPRLAAVRALKALGANAAPAVGALIDLLKIGDGMVEVTTPQSGERLFSYNPVQSLTVDTLATIGAPAVEPMRAALGAADPDGMQMSYLAAALVKTEQPVALSTVREMLRSQTPMVRRRGADALGFSRDPVSIDALIALLSDPDPAVRLDAQAALETISGHRYGQDVAQWEAWRKVRPTP